jgi:hypothetical protein
VSAVLTGDGTRATARVDELGSGRRIAFATDDLPVLPKKDFYELWFVGPGDRPGAPNRISAGAFHPDPEGRSRVIFHAAVNPRNYPGLAVTREPGDGDPDPTLFAVSTGNGRARATGRGRAIVRVGRRSVRVPSYIRVRGTLRAFTVVG